MASASRRNQRSEAVRHFLAGSGLDGLIARAGGEPAARRVLLSLLCDGQEPVRWQAVAGLGRLAEATAARDPEAVRDLTRRLLWSMNDESGSLIHFAPQAIGEIIARVPRLSGEFREILSSYAEIEPFQAGVRWALDRIAAAHPDAVTGSRGSEPAGPARRSGGCPAGHKEA